MFMTSYDDHVVTSYGMIYIMTSWEIIVLIYLTHECSF